MNPVSQDIAAVLAAEGYGTLASASDWGIYRQTMPDKPKRCIVVRETPSPPPVTPLNRAVTNTNPWETAVFQVEVRGVTDAEVWTKIRLIGGYLNGKKQWLVTDPIAPVVKYSAVLRLSDYFPLDTGAHDCFSRSVNFTAYRQEQLPT